MSINWVISKESNITYREKNLQAYLKLFYKKNK